MILTLENSDTGYLDIHTLQRDVLCDVASLGMQPLVWDCGGIKNEICVTRLPVQPSSNEFAFDLDLKALHLGDNPIYIRVTQEDAHMAWTSPVYVVKGN